LGNTRQIGARSIHSLAESFLYFLWDSELMADQAPPQDNNMKKVLALTSIVLALAAANTALARTHHDRSGQAPYSHIDSGWGPPTNWNEIEISHPEGGG
jgi:hypothetical protein